MLAAFATPASALLGAGGEASVYALGDDRVLRIHRPGPSRDAVVARAALLRELAENAPALPFAIPRVLDAAHVEERWVTIEPRLPGRPLSELLPELSGEARRDVVRSYLDATRRLAQIELPRSFYGELWGDGAIRTASFREYLEQRARRSLDVAGETLSEVDARALSLALPELGAPSFVYLDAYPSNVLIDGGQVSAIVDFGGAAIIGKAWFGAVVSATYLQPPDEPLVRSWLAELGWSELYEPVRRWIAAYWSFATDDRALFDLGFARKVVAHVQSLGCIDAKRIYAVGVAPGGGMAYALACKAADVFAGVAPAAWDLLKENVADCSPSRPITVISFRGTADFIVPYDGSYSTLVEGMPITFLGAQSTFKQWAQLDGCTGAPSDPDSNGCSTYSGCAGGVVVTLCSKPNGNLEAGNPAIAWPVLKQHPMP